MRIIRHERSQSSTVVYLEMDDGSTYAHCILDGILEDRQEAWELPDEVDPLDLVLVESHYAAEEMPGPFEDGYVANRERVLELVGMHKNKISGDKSAVRASCQLAPEDSERLRRRMRAEFTASRSKIASGPASIIDSAQRVNSDLKEIRKGFERLDEERLADEIIMSSPELKRIPRVRPEDSVGLTVKFT